MVKNLAVVFPGQGSQTLGMLSEFEDSAWVRETFSEASAALNYNLWTLCQEGPEATLHQTEYAQPALLTACVALYRQACQTTAIHNEVGMFAGHSVGEYSALVCAEALSLTAGVQLVAERGRLMQNAVPVGVGSMAAILGLSDEEVAAVCEANSSNECWVTPANYNCPQQVVIAGHHDAVQKAMEQAKTMGAKRAIPLSVSVPSHCALMKTAADSFAQVLDNTQINPPNVRILHNVDVSEHQKPSEIRQALVQQLYQPVRWNETIQKMELLGIQSIIECGPKTVLTALNKRISSTLRCSMLSLEEVMERV